MTVDIRWLLSVVLTKYSLSRIFNLWVTCLIRHFVLPHGGILFKKTFVKNFGIFINSLYIYY